MGIIEWVEMGLLAITMVLAAVLTYLFIKGRADASDMGALAGLAEKFAGVISAIGSGDSLIAKLAEYAAEAVRAVEQMVKSGQLEKDDNVRKNEARAIIETLALKDGWDADEISECREAIDVIIEAEVFGMSEGSSNLE